MTGRSGTLRWLQNARRHIESSQEWKDFTIRLFDAVQQQMTESHVNVFTDLLEAEKAFVLQRAAKAIQRGDLYKAMISQISTCLEEQLYSQVAHEMRDGDHLRSKLSLVSSHIRNGVMNLLEERPELKGKMHAFLNQPLPADFRRLTWRLYLSNPRVCRDYLSQVAANKAKSPKDREIFLKSRALLSTEPTFQHLKDNEVAARCLRNVLSYYHKLQGTATHLPDMEYFLLLPLLQVALDPAAPNLSTDSISALLVEEFITFMNLRPRFMRLSFTQDAAGTDVLGEVSSMLHEQDRDLTTVIKGIYSQAEETQESLLRAVKHMLQPAISTLFVGYLSMDTLLYVWDQLIIGLDQPSYNCFPAFSAVFILLLRDYLKTCQSPGQVEAALKTRGPTLSVEEFQDMIRRHYFKELYSRLHEDDNEPFPIHDPTQALPPWSYLSRVTVPPRTRPEDRKQARKEREMLEKQHKERLKHEERLQKFREEEERRQQESRLLQLLEETKGTFEAQRVYLKEQLTQEKQLRYEMQKAAEAQISGLEDEIKKLQEQQRCNFWHILELLCVCKARIIIIMYGTVHWSLPWMMHALWEVTSGMSRNIEIHGKTAAMVTLDLLEQIMQAANAIANGHNAAEQGSLNAATREHLWNYSQDCKNAEIEVFGHHISREDIEKIPEPRRKELKKKLTGTIRRNAEARHKAQLAVGKGMLPDSVIYM
ncbi:uncharacterized protein LOC102563695 isoform X2 [Alligator mississippiensis]|uniref:Uncharacterized protein n=1 Tax=Alligator mississippiensis TaxID=8496 RepID=A0A151NAM2_ALLMI|nr:uncharacterized protein LOC102563695 isoform X2 [Alligator mississippiensis]KYO33787.1 hypothetical protein Y1Q_0015322 [Alligator mississippiensis]